MNSIGIPTEWLLSSSTNWVSSQACDNNSWVREASSAMTCSLSTLVLTFFPCGGDKELRGHDKVELNIWQDYINEFFHRVTAGQGGMHTENESDRGGEVCGHHVWRDPMILLSQPSKHLFVEYQVMEAGVGFQDNEISELFLDDVGLQVHDILLDIVANLRDVANVFNWGTHWIEP
jgi:hypothetical protein